MYGSTAFEAGTGCCRQGPSGQPCEPPRIDPPVGHRHAVLAKARVERIDVGYRETNVIDARRIVEKAKLTTDRRGIWFSCCEKEEPYALVCYEYAALVPVFLRKTQPLIKRHRSRQVGRADADVVDASHHAHSLTLGAVHRGWSGRHIVIETE